MKIAITIWGNRISPVFESATTLMIADMEKSIITNRIFKEFSQKKILPQTLSIFKKYQVGILICGAITDAHSQKIEQSGIKLISFITGNADKVLAAYIKDRHRIFDFLMPGMMSDSVLNKKNLTFYS
ncbi:MAG: dinitrogenase iron-molybdenum cofactor biosynthesis domain-containing protein [Desulfobacteraceae bacterium]|nr:dinitrogenase iron-molybdenum cofactor biosynthesis domain-containing protein [Desulfobacteraceae bacterium]